MNTSKGKITSESIKQFFIKSQTGAFKIADILADDIFNASECIFNDKLSPSDLNKPSRALIWIAYSTPLIKRSYCLDYVGFESDIDEIPITEEYHTAFNADDCFDIEAPADFEYITELESDEWDKTDWEASTSLDLDYQALNQIEYYIEKKKLRLVSKFSKLCTEIKSEYISLIAEDEITLSIPYNYNFTIDISGEEGRSFRLKTSSIVQNRVEYTFQYLGK